VGGYTGSGKTGVIHQLKKQNLAAIDLEGLANHKGSSFGGIGMAGQPTQEMFENLLALELSMISTLQNNLSLLDKVFAEKSHSNIGFDKAQMQSPTKIWVEDESQRIGNLNLPPSFWLQMRKSHVYFLDIPFEERLEYLVDDYGKCDREKILTAIIRIKKRLGGLETKSAVNFLLEDNLKECFRILLTYYDKHYLKGLQNRDNWQQKVSYVPSPKVETDNNTRLLLNSIL
jgi:tRNA 2-selenouridine synthase